MLCHCCCCWFLAASRPLFDGYESPEALYMHFSDLRAASSSSSSSSPSAVQQSALLPPLPSGLCPHVAEVLVACLQLEPGRRATASQLLDMQFFAKEY
jgi:hypothetical protein